MGILSKQTIQIDINPENSTYSIDFCGVKLRLGYLVLKNIVKEIESGEFFRDSNLELTDANGNVVSGDEARAEIIGDLKKGYPGGTD